MQRGKSSLTWQFCGSMEKAFAGCKLNIWLTVLHNIQYIQDIFPYDNVLAYFYINKHHTNIHVDIYNTGKFTPHGEISSQSF